MESLPVSQKLHCLKIGCTVHMTSVARLEGELFEQLGGCLQLTVRLLMLLGDPDRISCELNMGCRQDIIQCLELMLIVFRIVTSHSGIIQCLSPDLNVSADHPRIGLVALEMRSPGNEHCRPGLN